MTPAKAYRGVKGELFLFVRHEDRKGIKGDVFVAPKNGVLYTTWLPEGTAKPGELVNDTAGRTEAAIAILEREKLEKERNALLVVVRRAVRWLASSQADELRKLHAKLIGTPSDS